MPDFPEAKKKTIYTIGGAEYRKTTKADADLYETPVQAQYEAAKGAWSLGWFVRSDAKKKPQPAKP